MIGILTNDSFLKIKDVEEYFTENVDEEWKIYKIFDEIYDDRDKIDIILSSGRLDGEKIKNFKNLKRVFSYTTGVDKYPLDSLNEMGVVLTNTKGVQAKSISEQVLGVMISFSRNLFKAYQNKAERKYEKYPMYELYNKRLLIIGMGSIGRELARRAKAFDMRIAGVRNHVDGKDQENFDEVYPTSELKNHLSGFDYIVSILPSTESTRDLYNYDLFKAMDKNTIFMNVGRGDAVIEDDLIRSLKDGEIRGAYLDVFQNEPLSPSSDLWDLDNLVITPHIAGPTPFYFERAMVLFQRNLEEFRKNKELSNTISYEERY
ncbi:D-2-hydroxyacid dehydrogenase [Anaerococcus sp. AGMB09787]|uniref:D-2-hydroxyacid dehydrogenase n=1 Tax=Anaerococcus sp. AGMB09787 TaxID=2922869 RepID=UPI001FAEC38D|nr:D-2-hydroxyacid dehydrogenase [Anaerococcus sp. AGMB09787]